MRRSRRPPIVESDVSDDEDDRNGKRPRIGVAPASDSSSESDIEKYLMPVGKIDLSSSFFEGAKGPRDKPGPSRIESSSEEEAEERVESVVDSRIVEQFNDYTRKMEETKRSVEAYEAKRKILSKKRKQPRNRRPEPDLDVSDLLALGESKGPSTQEVPARRDDLTTSDEEDTNWEEVEHEEPVEGALVPSGPVEIRVGMPEHCRKKKGDDLLAAMKRRLNRVRKENQVYVHKVHLLCWIAHGNYVNNSLNDPEVLASALSLIPSEKSYPSGRPDLGYLEQALQWYKKTILLKDKKVDVGGALVEELVKQIAKKSASNYKMYVYIFVAVMRALGLSCRVVLSFRVEPLRPPSNELHSLAKEEPKVKKPVAASKRVQDKKELNVQKRVKKDDPKDKKTSAAAKGPQVKGQKNGSTAKKKVETMVSEGANKEGREPNGEEKTSYGARSRRSLEKDGKAMSVTRATRDRVPDKKEEKSFKFSNKAIKRNEKKKVPKSSNKLPEKNLLKSGKDDAAPRSTRSLSQKLLRSRSGAAATALPQLDGADDETPPKRKTRSSRIDFGKLKARASCTSEDEFSPSDKRASRSTPSRPGPSRVSCPLDVRIDIVRLMKGRIAEQRSLDRAKLAPRRSKKVVSSDSDSDYAPEPLAKKRHDSDSDLEYFVETPKVKRRVPAKIVSSDDNGGSPHKSGRQGRDVWAEVFLDAEERWVTVDVVRGQLHCVNEIYSRATHPVTYVVAWDGAGALKDVTMRYCKNFGTVTRKLRIDPKWWEETLRPFRSKDAVRDKEEDDDLARQQLDQPLPKAISEYKDHPLYALRRHLLKFEAIYPPDQVPLGYVRSEPVYPRNCVYVCKSRDIWLKDARVVKPGEKPYKVVKARPKYDRLSNKMVTGQMLEIFGPWQTMDYEPPTAENGVVPRNAFGNVELFKPCMLPKGTVHLTLPGLNKVCRKLNIDCANAVIGFDFHSGWCHPTFDGFVVCEEFADKVVAAWDIEQEEMERKEKEKIEARVYGNWKKLIRGLLIRERLKAKYDMGKKSKATSK